MEPFNGLFHNKILICSIIAWIIAQLIKFIIGLIKTKHVDFRLLSSSGGMPSSHSSTVTCLTSSIGIVHGFNSALFAISFVFAVIVMYDAAGVRRAAGEQAKILNRLVADLEDGKTTDINVHLKELLGHTPREVLFGALLGIMISVCAFVLPNLL